MCEYIQGSFFRALFNAAKKEQEHYNFIYSSFKFFFFVLKFQTQNRFIDVKQQTISLIQSRRGKEK